MKKVLAIALTLVLVFSLAACGGSSNDSGTGGSSDTGSGGGGGSGSSSTSFGQISWADGETPIALVTDYGTIDDESFNQGSWEGIVAFASANNIPHQYIQPAEVSTAAYVDAIELAINDGAQIIVTPGFMFSGAIFEAQETWPDVKFVLLDATPSPDGGGEGFTGSNTVSVLYAEQQSGFLAGYAAVIDGHRSLGFIGGIAVPAVVRFGHGFVEGAQYAANELSLASGDISVRFAYAGTFNQSPDVQTMAASWYADGIEVIFAAAGGAGLSVFAAAEATSDGLAIGVDVDQGHHSNRVVTSALKDLRSSVANVLGDFFAGSFPGGQEKLFDAAIDGVGLPSDFSRFTTFGQAEYNTIFAQLASGAVSVSTELGDESNRDPGRLLNVPLVSVTYIG